MSQVARLVDANAGRAREGLRVVEDVARFVLCDGALAGEFKSIRHGLQEAVGGLPIDRGVLLAWRDAAGDVGAASSTAGERSRADLSAIVAAAGGRVTEALRAIEEAAKVLGGDAVGVERLRYRAYDGCGAVERALGTGRAEQWRLCVLLTEALCVHQPWLRVAELAMDGGADCVQLREKTLETGELVERARALVALARPRGVRVVVNDRVDVALAAGADGVHVGQGDMGVRDVRRLAGNSLLVGVSTGSVEEARAAAAAGADYCGVGPMFVSTTKRKPRVAGVEYLRGYLGDGACARVPHLAIGGITPGNVGGLVEAGCRGVAVSSVVCGAVEPGEVCREILAGVGG
ncbi:MAG: thiamine phosphate synthase [Planctomycetota bacterium]|nr:thiamine phosphate synthase [Planctomycetota bacterium]